MRALCASKLPGCMRPRRTLVAASLTSFLAAGAIATVPAGAQEPVPYRASAAATALELSILGQGLTIGANEVAVDGTPVATASAHGALLPGLGLVGGEQADLANPGDDQPTCSPLTLPGELTFVELAVACGTAAAAEGPSAAATAGITSLSVSATNLLNDTPLSELPVQDTLDQVLAGLAPVFDVVEQLGLDAESLVSDLLTGITDGGDVVTVELGPAAAIAAAEGETGVAAQGAAQAAVIEVVDRSLLNLPPVLTIEVGAAAARVEADRTTGTATPVIEPALVRVRVASDIAALLGIPEVTEVTPGQDICLPLPDPLASCITVAGGRTLDTEDGGKRAETEGVGLRLLTGLPGGGIVLNLAAASAEAAAAAPVQPAPQETPRQEGSLPRTGVEDNLPLALALAAVGAAGLSLVAATRRRGASL